MVQVQEDRRRFLLNYVQVLELSLCAKSPVLLCR